MDKEYKIKIGKIIFSSSEDCSWKLWGDFYCNGTESGVCNDGRDYYTAFNCTDEMGYTEAFDVSGHYFVVGDCCVDLFPAYGQ